MEVLLLSFAACSRGVSLNPPGSRQPRGRLVRDCCLMTTDKLVHYHAELETRCQSVSTECGLSGRVPLSLSRARRQILRNLVAGMISVMPLTPHSAPAIAPDSFISRLSTDTLTKPSIQPSSVDPILPAWLEGRWKAEQTLVAFSTPLGVKFISAAGQALSEAEASAEETRSQIGKTVSFELKFIRAGEGCREDREFNSQQRLDAFAGRPVVKQAKSCAAAGVDGADSAIACSFVDFKTGGVSQKTLVNDVRVETPVPDAVVIDEFQRIILGRRPAYDVLTAKTRSFPPITTDQENVLLLRRDMSAADPLLVNGRLRLASYLQPLDPLFFDAAGQAVSISDFRLKLTRIAGDE